MTLKLAMCVHGSSILKPACWQKDKNSYTPDFKVSDMLYIENGNCQAPTYQRNNVMLGNMA